MKKIHASETAWVGTNFDVIIDNNSTIDDLYHQAEKLVIGNKITLPPSDSFFAKDISTVGADSF
jgi:hypothetical protein